eukprot:EG_transcript_7318
MFGRAGPGPGPPVKYARMPDPDPPDESENAGGSRSAATTPSQRGKRHLRFPSWQPAEIEMSSVDQVQPPAYSDLFSDGELAADDNEEDAEMLMAYGEDEEGHEWDAGAQGASVFTCTMNLANSIMGAGILGLPYALQSVGTGWGAAAFLGVGGMSAFTMYLLVAGSSLVGVASYEALMGKAFGRAGQAFLEVVMVLSVLGVLTAYLVLLADFAEPILCRWAASLNHAGLRLLLWRPALLGSLVAGAVLPLALVRRLAALRAASAASLLLMLGFVLALAYRALVPFTAGAATTPPAANATNTANATNATAGHRTLLTAPWANPAFNGIPIITFAFSCHVCVFPIYNSLERPSQLRMLLVIAGAMAICAGLYGSVALLGFVQFGAAMCPNLLNNFAPDDALATAVRAAFTVAIVTTYPLALFAARRSFDMLVFPTASAKGLTNLRFVCETLLLVSVTYLLAALAPGVRIVFAFSGAIFATTIAFVIPALCFVRLTPVVDCRTLAALLVLLVGLALGSLSTIANVQAILDGDPTPPHCRSTGHCSATAPD